ncbi:MAG: YegS/Rv2252/BmrU family lipid kinase [Crocinitomicaceae bacterium]|nr:YegS/Rv2252/BmrU family lipid kinase [Crocinitomicaceae bacterium]
MRIAFILNGNKKKTKFLPEKILAYNTHSYICSFFTTSSRGDAVRLAFKCAPDYDLVVATGGDGTLNECLNGLMQFRDQFPEKNFSALALLPIGTGNDFIRNFSRRPDTKSLMNCDIPSSLRKIDVCKVSSGNQRSRYFINIADAGFGPVAIDFTEQLPAGIPGSIKFGIGILRAFFTYRKKTISVKSELINRSGRALTVVLANGKYFGGGVAIAPNADLYDGQMELIIIGNVSMVDYLRYLPKLRKGKKIEHPEVFYARVDKVELSGEGGIEMDGELEFELPVRVEVVREGINFVVP